MSNGVPISGLPAATTPLAGTELAAIVQSGTTKKVAVSHIGGGSVSGVAGGVAFFDTNTSVTTANPVTNFTWDDGLQILTVTGTIVLGTSSANQASTLLLDSAHQLAWDNGAGGLSFVFKDLGGGVCQIADPNFLWNKAAAAINSPVNFAVQAIGGTGNALMQVNPDGSWSISNAAGVQISNAVAGNLDLIGAAAVDASTGNIQFSDPSAATAGLTLNANGSAAGLSLTGDGSVSLVGGAAGGTNLAYATDGSWSLNGPVGSMATDAAGKWSFSNNNGGWHISAATAALGGEGSQPDIGAASGFAIGTVYATAYYANDLQGFSGTITTASLVGKTITVTGGVITGFA